MNPHMNPKPACAAAWQDTLPERLGRYEYWTRQTPQRPQPCYLRRALPGAGPAAGPAAGAGAGEEVVLDCNTLARRLGGDCVGHVRHLAPAWLL
jgi:protease II